MATAPSDKKRKADLKVVIIGDASVGKTSFIKRYKDGVFNDELEQTIGACFYLTQWGEYNIALWDTAGEERFSGLSAFYCRDASAAIMAYDITNHSSFEVLHERYVPLLESAKEDCLLCLTGMKGDLVTGSTREVSQAEARESSLRLNAGRFQHILKSNPRRKIVDPFFETSSKSGKNVEEVFAYIFSSLLPDNGMRKVGLDKNSVEVSGEDKQANKKDGGCCT